MIKGMTVTLYERTYSGTDAFNHANYTESAVDVINCLVAPAGENEILDTLNLTGKTAQYQIAVPKGDTHNWENCKVGFFGQYWRVIGKPVQGQEENIPLLWNKKLMVESYVEG